MANICLPTIVKRSPKVGVKGYWFTFENGREVLCNEKLAAACKEIDKNFLKVTDHEYYVAIYYFLSYSRADMLIEDQEWVDHRTNLQRWSDDLDNQRKADAFGMSD